MFDEKTILARLQNGEDAQAIADEMAAMINAANKAYADQKAAEEAAKKSEVQKREALQGILDELKDWLNEYYGVPDSAMSEVDVDDVLELIDSLQGYIEALKGLESMLKKPGAKPVKKIVKTGNPDKILNDFLKDMGW